MAKKEPELILRGLQELLCESIGDQVLVVTYKTENFLPKGENYAGTILKVDSVIKRTKDSLEENLPLVAKMVPTKEYQQSSHFNSTVSFNKEIFVYHKLMPALREFEIEFLIKSKDLIDITPKYYGGRLSMNTEKSDVADEDAVILMENLIEHGYKMMDRKTGLDLNHAKLVLRELARFHALTTAMKSKKPELFDTAKKALQVCPFESTEKNIDNIIDQFISTICKDHRIARYEDRIRINGESNKNWELLNKIEPVDPWISIIHGDCWVNNVMFKQESGKPRYVKFIDFQLTRVSSPAKDLPYFLCANVKTDVIDKYFDELLNLYFNTFIQVLIMTNCDISPFTRESFDEQIKKEAGCELLRCLWAIKAFTEKFDQNQDQSNNVYLERSWVIISKYVEKNWI